VCESSIKYTTKYIISNLSEIIIEMVISTCLLANEARERLLLFM